MSRRRELAAAAGRGHLVTPLLVAALVLSSCTASQDPGPDAGPTAASGPGTAAPTADVTPGPTPDGADGATAGPDGKPKTDGNGKKPETAASAAPDGRSGGQNGAEGSEVAPPAPGRPSGDGLGDSVAPAAGRLTRDQRTGTAEGLVAGFPDDVVLVPAGTAVASSSVTGTDGRYQVTLDAKVDGACDAVVLDYRSWFTSGGFTETGTTARPGRTTVDLARADGTVQLGTSRTRGGCDVTVFAALSAK
ncbi:hypothetical protein APR04_001439 [Promicromonospora umidemergens]|uniref:Uncharacterized protein n=1 Tax=Promicromonospora umidemergens TaxID=629679 RepID=A0ABP8Y5A9_9MICO|nr:hypothetical protein [Promicromonospora umidemergens]MCP2282541.1 hypothetical protein [Promicromonospora umidemergens]